MVMSIRSEDVLPDGVRSRNSWGRAALADLDVPFSIQVQVLQVQPFLSRLLNTPYAPSITYLQVQPQ